MRLLDKFCRFCTNELHPTQRMSIFSLENRQLLKTALECIPMPMSPEDKFPNYTCFDCAYKLNDIALFRSKGISAVGFFCDYLAKNDSNATPPVENRDETSIKIERVEETEESEVDFVVEYSPKIETRSDETVECVPAETEISAQERQRELIKSAVEFGPCYSSPTIEIPPSGNVSSDDDEAILSKNKFNLFSKQKFGYKFKKEEPNIDNRYEQSFNITWHYTSNVNTEETPFQREQPNFQTENQHQSEVPAVVKPYKCEKCPKSFFRKGNMVYHQKVHNDANPFKCKYCKKAFTGRMALVNHTRIHTGEKPFECDHCQKKFSQKSQMVAHERLHTGKTRFNCGYCEKGFAGRLALVNHTRIHTGEKPFRCDYCGKLFATKSNLYTHIRIHLGVKRFKCKDCKKLFSRKNGWIRHKSQHTG